MVDKGREEFIHYITHYNTTMRHKAGRYIMVVSRKREASLSNDTSL